MREKLAVTTLVIMLALFALIFRIWYIQDHFGEEYNQRVLAQQQYDSRIIPYRRGDIVDRNGTFLATTNKVYTLILDPYIINQDQDKYLEPTVTLLSEVFGYSQDDLRKIIADRSDSRYVRYAKNLTYDQKTQFESRMKEMNDGFRKEAVQQRVNGAWFEDAYIRSYPQGALGCNVIGFSQSEGAEGSGGIEQYYNSQLVGTAGREYGYLNDEANLERVIKPAADGNTVVSTIDVRVQSIIERHIAAFEAEMGGNNTCVIVMNPKNGEILGMATNHRFDLNDPRNLDAYFTPEQQAAMTDEQRFEAWNLLWRNFCVSDTYEPGSTSKIFTVAAGLENGTINGTEVYNCGGSLEVGGWHHAVLQRRHDAHRPGPRKREVRTDAAAVRLRKLHRHRPSRGGGYLKPDLFRRQDGLCRPGHQLLRPELQLHHDPDGGGILLRDQRRKLLPAPCGEADPERPGLGPP